jgi:uncharacterized protein (DUF4213/DUF364 family)
MCAASLWRQTHRLHNTVASDAILASIDARTDMGDLDLNLLPALDALLVAAECIVSRPADFALNRL